MPILLERWRLLYDAECHFCTRFARIIERFDRHGQVVPISLQDYCRQDPLAPLDALRAELHILGPRGEVLQGGAAVGKLIDLIPQAAPVRWMATSRWGRRGAESLYGTLHRMRRCPKCPSG